MTKNIRQFGVDDPDGYWRERQERNRVTERRLHRFLPERVDLIVPAGGNVLDCGVGPGHVFRLCREKHETYGVEISSEAIEMYDFPTDNIRQADLNDGIPDFGVKFDAIIISMVLHWLVNPGEFLSQAKAKLSEHGRLLVVIPNITNYHYRIKYLFGIFPPISSSHKNFQTPTEVEQMFSRAGYEIEKKLSPKKKVRSWLWPNLFSSDIVYILKPII